MPTPLDVMRSPFSPPLTHFVPDGAINLGDELSRTQVMTCAELRALASQWRAVRAPEDIERATRVACALEWLANYREPKARTRLEELGERISGWVGL